MVEPGKPVALEPPVDNRKLITEMTPCVAPDRETNVIGGDDLLAAIPAVGFSDRSDLKNNPRPSSGSRREQGFEPRQAAKAAPGLVVGSSCPIHHEFAVERHVGIQRMEHAAEPRPFADQVFSVWSVITWNSLARLRCRTTMIGASRRRADGCGSDADCGAMMLLSTSAVGQADLDLIHIDWLHDAVRLGL